METNARRSSGVAETTARPPAPCRALIVSAVLLLIAVPRLGAAAEPERDAVVGGTPVIGTPRVIGGDIASPGRWPSMVALVRTGASSPADRQFCGGTVIAPRWVMTAAHCLFDAFRRQVEPSDIRVVAGVSDLRVELGSERDVTNLFVHPEYDHVAQDAYNDIALIEVATTLDAPAVPLFGGDTEALGFAPGIVVGWGATEFTTPRRATYPDALHQAVVPLVPRAVCNDPLSYAGYVGEGQLCAGFAEGGVDTCVGDSGGPLFVDTGARVEQVGVVSYGRGCAEPLFYGIYTNVSAYRSWIGEFVELAEPADDTLQLDRPRGPAAAPPVLAEAPIDGVRPPEGEPADGSVDGPADGPEVAPPSGDGDGLFGAAVGAPWWLALLGFAGGRRLSRARPGRVPGGASRARENARRAARR